MEIKIREIKGYTHFFIGKRDIICLCPNCHGYVHEVLYKLYKKMSSRNCVRTADFFHSVGKENEHKISILNALIWKNKE